MNTPPLQSPIAGAAFAPLAWSTWFQQLFQILGTLAGGTVGGTLAATNGSTAIVGKSGASFLTLTACDPITIQGVVYTIASVTDATHATLTATYTGTTAAGATWTAASVLTPTNDGAESLGNPNSAAPLRWLNLFLTGLLEIRANRAQVHLSTGGTGDAGAWLAGRVENVLDIMVGARFDGTAGFIATATAAAILVVTTTGVLFFADTGLTVGSVYSPPQRFAIDGSGNITQVATITAQTVNATTGYKANGTAGESVTLTYLTGTPGTGQSSKTVTFKEGLETAHT